MKLALAAYEFRNNDTEFNLSQIERALSQADGKAELCCFGEAFLQGFDCLTWRKEEDAGVAVSRDSDIFRRLLRMTETYRTGIGFGYIEREGESFYSSYAVMAEGRLLYNYRRISRGWHGKADPAYREGSDTAGFTFRGRSFALALCGDMWDFPLRFRSGDVFLWPVYLNFSLDEWKEEITDYAARAASAAPVTLCVNSISREPVSHGGAFVFKNGSAAEGLPFDSEGLLFTEV